MTLDNCADTVLDTLRRVRRFDRVVLVAHSAGGGPASLAAERAPELVDRVVYLSAFVPTGHPRFFDYLSAPENTTAQGQSLNLGNPGALSAVRIDLLSPDPAYVEELRQTHYHDTPADRFDRWRSALSPDLPLTAPAPPITLTAGRWGRVPRTFLRCADDQALPTATQDLMIAEADRAMPGEPFTVRTLPGSHSPFAARPQDRRGSDAVNDRPSLLPMMVSAPLVQLLDVTVAKIAVLAIQSGLSVSPGSMQLVLAGYTLACACLLITAARLGNGYRYQRLFALGTTVFTAASVACLGWLIAARLVQRAGIGLVAPQTLSRIRTGVSPERRPRALALYGATTGMASPAGPLISGLLVGADLFSLH